MFCMNCGKPLPDGSKFCPHCGTPVISSEGKGSSEEGPSLDDLLKKVDKKEEKISLDIDLLSFDDRVLKPEELKREYVVKGLEELKYNQI